MAKTKTKGSKKLISGFKCEVCGKKAVLSSEKYGKKCWTHVPVVKEKWWL